MEINVSINQAPLQAYFSRRLHSGPTGRIDQQATRTKADRPQATATAAGNSCHRQQLLQATAEAAGNSCHRQQLQLQATAAAAAGNQNKVRQATGNSWSGRQQLQQQATAATCNSCSSSNFLKMRAKSVVRTLQKRALFSKISTNQ